MIGKLFGAARRFLRAESGVVLTETLIVLPVMTVFTVGILEFGNMMWQRQQLQVGVRDAARYWSRCRPTFMGCDQAIAKRIAFYGHADPNLATLRVPGWTDTTTELIITPATPPTNVGLTDVVQVTGTVTYSGSPLFDLILSEAPTITYQAEMRYIGW